MSKGCLYFVQEYTVYVVFFLFLSRCVIKLQDFVVSCFVQSNALEVCGLSGSQTIILELGCSDIRLKLCVRWDFEIIKVVRVNDAFEAHSIIIVIRSSNPHIWFILIHAQFSLSAFFPSAIYCFSHDVSVKLEISSPLCYCQLSFQCRVVQTLLHPVTSSSSPPVQLELTRIHSLDNERHTVFSVFKPTSIASQNLFCFFCLFLGFYKLLQQDLKNIMVAYVSHVHFHCLVITQLKQVIFSLNTARKYVHTSLIQGFTASSHVFT